MNLLLLPGNSPDHKSWIEELSQLFKPVFDETYAMEYENWKSPHARIVDLDVEGEKIKKAISGWSDYCVFAKSVGVALTLKSIREGVLKPSKCIFVGSPFLWTRENNIDLDSWIIGFSIPTLFIQQRFDPCMPSDDLKQLLIDKRVANYKFQEVFGDDHKYSNLEELINLSREFIF